MDELSVLEDIIQQDITRLMHVGDQVFQFKTTFIKKVPKNRITNTVKVITYSEDTERNYWWTYEETLPHLKTPPSLEKAWK